VSGSDSFQAQLASDQVTLPVMKCFERKVWPAQPGGITSKNQEVALGRDNPGLRSTLRRLYNQAVDLWGRVQIGNRSLYSVERLLSFRDYCERTSRSRVCLVCLLAPAPALVVMLLIECIPLRSPDEGWRANTTTWIRIFVSTLFVAGGMVCLARAMLREAAISIAQAVVMTITAAVCYTAGSILLAATWKFPVPFGMVLLVCPFSTLVMGLIILSIGPRRIMTNDKLRYELARHIVSVSAQALLVVAYPTFNAVFLQLNEVEQALFIFVLPVIKFIAKQVTASASAHVEDTIGAGIVFSVDVFNVLYVAICMQTARSPLTTVLVMSFDAFHIVVALRSIYIHTKAASDKPKRHHGSCSFVDRILASLGGRTHPNAGLIHFYGPYKLPLSTSSASLLEKLEAKWRLERMAPPRPVTTAQAEPIEARPPSQMLHSKPPLFGPSVLNTETARPHQMRQSASSRLASNVSLRLNSPPAHLKNQKSRRSSLGEKLSGLDNDDAAEEGLQVLFHCEYVVLTEYVECVLPLFYAAYLAGTYQLPSAAFYPFIRSMTRSKMESTLAQLVLYGSLEFVSFAGLHVLLKNRLGYSPVYQLAFVLETHSRLIQSLLFIWTIFIVQLTIVHVGRLHGHESTETGKLILSFWRFLCSGVDFNAPFQ
jgi:hypothetical protein